MPPYRSFLAIPRHPTHARSARIPQHYCANACSAGECERPSRLHIGNAPLLGFAFLLLQAKAGKQSQTRAFPCHRAFFTCPDLRLFRSQAPCSLRGSCAASQCASQLLAVASSWRSTLAGARQRAAACFLVWGRKKSPKPKNLAQTTSKSL